MPQWRKLHVKTVDSMDINEMPDDFTRLLWVMLPLGLDSAGRAIDDAGWLKSKLMPLRRDVDIAQVEAAMAWYASRGMIRRYEVNGRKYFQVPTFGHYQGNTEREAASGIPEPVKQPRKKSVEKVVTDSRPTHESVTTQSSLDVDSDSEVEEKILAGENPPAPLTTLPTDPVKELAAVFEQVAGIKQPPEPSKNNLKARKQIAVLWWQPLREMVRLANGTAADLLRQAISQMRRDRLTLSSPNSVLKVFTSLYGAACTGGGAASMELRAAGYVDAHGNPV